MENLDLNKMFQEAKSDVSEVSNEQVMDRFRESISSGQSAREVNLDRSMLNGASRSKFWITMTVLVSTLSLVVFLLSGGFGNTNNNNSPILTSGDSLNNANENEHMVQVDSSGVPEVIEIESIEIKDETLHQHITTYPNPDRDDKNMSKTADNLQRRDTIVKVPLGNYQGGPIYQDNDFSSENQDTVWAKFYLTPELVRENNKRKQQMLKELYKMNKKHYAFIPSGSYRRSDKKVSVHSFYMQTTEVTVVQYRTFLYDLRIQGKKAEFLAAKPKQDAWKIIRGIEQKSYMDPMVKLYFSHPAYDNYPVNNISREGARLYCKWLTEEFRKSAYGAKKDIPDVRLPTDMEWEYAALGGATSDYPKYPWGTNYPRDGRTGCFLVNYQPTDQDFGEGEEPANGEKLGYYSDGAFFTAKVTSYYPNEYGLYCLGGNVSEMIVQQEHNRKAGTKGGSWVSTLDELRIFGPDPFDGETNPDPEIGFRVVISYLNR